MKRRLLGGAVGALTLVGAVVFVTSAPAQAFGRATQIALIESPTGPNGGTIPTSALPNPPFATQPAYANVTTASVASSDNFLTTNLFDTAILNQVCDIGTLLNGSNGNFKADLVNFVTNGGKLLIWDSGCVNTDYSQFVFPFHTANPGLTGLSGGTMTLTEQNALGNSSATNVNFIDPAPITSTTNAALNANQFFTTDPNWCVSMSVANANGANGGVVNYATLGSGLIVYSGLNMKNMTSTAYTPANSPLGPVQLNRILMNQLAIADTSTLHCPVKAQAVLTLTPKSQSQVVGQTAPLSAHLVSDGVPVNGGAITLTVTSGPDTNLPAAHANTDANGDAPFTYVSGIPGTNTLTASATAAVAGVTVTDAAQVTWVARVSTTTPPVTATPTFTG